MRLLVILLTILGGLLPVAALGWAWLVSRKEFDRLDRDLIRIQAIARRHPEPSEATPLMEAIRTPTATGATVLYIAEEVQRAILRSALSDLKGPALLAGAGAMAGTTGSWLSLYL